MLGQDIPMHDLFTGFVADVLFPLHKKLTGDRSTFWLERIGRSQWSLTLDPQTLQLSGRRAIFRDVAQHVPFFRERLAEAGLDAQSVDSVADLAQFPIPQ